MNYADLIFTMVYSVFYGVAAFAFVLIAKFYRDYKTTKFDDDSAIVDDKNMAVAVARFGLYVAIAIGIAGVVVGKSHNPIADFFVLFIDGSLVLGCLIAAQITNDLIMLPSLNNDDERQKNNVALGLVEAGSYIGTGLILNGSFTGDGQGFITGIIGALVFFVLGQVVMLGAGFVYQQMTSFDVRREIAKGNVACGFHFGTIMIAFGLILRKAIVGPFTSWGVDIASFCCWAAFGIAVLIGFNILFMHFILPKTSKNGDDKGNKLTTFIETDQNLAALTVACSGLLVVAIIISALI